MVRTLIIVLGYGALYVLFATQAAFFEVAPGVSLWAPLAGLNLALLVLFGLAYLPAVLVATLAGGLLGPPMPLLSLLLWSLLVTLGNGAAAAWLRRQQPAERPWALRFVQPLAVAALALPAVLNLLSTLTFTLTGRPGFGWDAFAATTFFGWLGDAVGILTLTPLLLVAVGPYVPAWGDEPAAAKGLLPAPGGGAVLEFLLEVGGIGLALYLAFFLPDTNGFQYYICLLPLLAIAWQHGLLRAVLGIFLINAGTVVMLHGQGEAAAEEIQVFMMVLALTGLFLGALRADNRRRLALLHEAHAALEAQEAALAAALAEVRHSLAAQTEERRRVETTLQASVDALKASRDELAATTEQQARLNEKLRASEQQLKELNARKDKFFSIVSHDVRNLLVSAIGFSKLLISDAETLPREMIKEFASHVHSSTTNTYDLLENLLTWARMQTGRMYYQKSWHGVDELIQNNIAMLQDNASRKGIRLEKHADRDAQVYADRNMINSVLQNLISNAIKFTERGGRVTVSSRAYNNTVEIAVSDTGVGISPDNVKKLFRIDMHHSSEGTEEEEGTGLGLVLCKEMIEKHEGRIWVESEVGKGSTFRFTLPCATEAAEDE